MTISILVNNKSPLDVTLRPIQNLKQVFFQLCGDTSNIKQSQSFGVEELDVPAQL